VKQIPQVTEEDPEVQENNLATENSKSIFHYQKSRLIRVFQ
jgi:hypothetical protein